MTAVTVQACKCINHTTDPLMAFLQPCSPPLGLNTTKAWSECRFVSHLRRSKRNVPLQHSFNLLQTFALHPSANSLWNYSPFTSSLLIVILSSQKSHKNSPTVKYPLHPFAFRKSRFCATSISFFCNANSLSLLFRWLISTNIGL